jgi:di/tricarboxylate transporter
MTFDQAFILILLAVTLTMFISDRWRFDLIALGSLFLGVIGGVVPANQAFDGFSHPAVITVAAVLIISRALTATGAVDLITTRLLPDTRNLPLMITVLCGLGAFLSAFMNNVGALALLMPVAIQLAYRMRRPPAALLMPLAFATILGGLVTLIGTPPNLIIADYRAQVSGAPFAMFDFALVGLAIAVAGVIFVGLFGWRLIPQRQRRRRSQRQIFDIEDYVAEAQVPPGSQLIGLPFQDVEEAIFEGGDIAIVGLVRADEQITLLPHRRVAEGDILILEAEPETLTYTAALFGLKIISSERDVTGDLSSDDVSLVEAVVGPRSRLRGQPLGATRFRRRYHVNVIAVSREGRPHRGRLSSLRVRAGDVLLVQGERPRIQQVIRSLGMLPLSRSPEQANMQLVALTGGIFAVAILATTIGWLPPAVAFGIAALLVILIKAVPTDEIYTSVDWPVIVLLGALTPVGAALESTGATNIITAFIGQVTEGSPAAVSLGLLMVMTILISSVINNAAAAVVMAPIGIKMAQAGGFSVDAFLMGVAVAASCAFLTPVGHQNNTLVMGPGGYHFTDYLRLGLPLTILILIVAIPMIILVWGL